ncbi:ABC transporter ATP-binding protein/permease [Bacillus sp. F19]|nr:ABC transporter ATP-binding protein/permease [Bacillus sp. F19]
MIKKKWTTFKNMFLIEDIRRTFTLLGPYLLKYKSFYISLFLIMLSQILLTIGFAWFFGTITDAAVQNETDKLKWLLPLGLGLLSISLATTYSYTYLESITINKVKLELKKQVLKHLLLLPVKKTANMRTGDLMTHFTNDVNCIEGVIGSNLLYLIQLPLTFAAVSVYIFIINWQMALIGFTVIPLAIIIGAVFGILLRNNSRKMFTQISDINSTLNEIFQGLSVIRSFLLEKKMSQKQNSQNQELFTLEMKNTKLRGFFYIGGEAITSITYITGLCLGAYFVSKSMITVGSLLTFVTLMQHLISPLTGLAGIWGSFQSSASAVERLSNVLNEEVELNHFPEYVPSKIKGSIQLKNITFSYDQQKNSIDNMTLDIPAGQTVAIVGPSGAGKSTLFHLIQGFYQPDSGTIMLDHNPEEHLPPSVVRSSFAYVAQETFLFSGTIKDNLLLARPNISNSELITAAKQANIHDFIMSLPNQYDTQVGERGVRLSGGQKQRLSIARAILKNAPILLLDEATSALDSESELLVKNALEAIKSKTTLIIAHRLSTIQHADFIVVMDEGKIVQMGRHEELITQEGLYRKLSNLQFKTKEKLPSLQAISQ